MTIEGEAYLRRLLGAGDVVGAQLLPQFISPSDAQAYLDRVNTDAVRLNVAIESTPAIFGTSDNASWLAQWRQWFAGWTAFYASNTGDTFWNAPNLYTSAEARQDELRRWYEQAASRGVQVGVSPSIQADAPGASQMPWYAWAAIAAGAVAVIVVARR